MNRQSTIRKENLFFFLVIVEKKLCLRLEKKWNEFGKKMWMKISCFLKANLLKKKVVAVCSRSCKWEHLKYLIWMILLSLILVLLALVIEVVVDVMVPCVCFLGLFTVNSLQNPALIHTKSISTLCRVACGPDIDRVCFSKYLDLSLKQTKTNILQI